MSKILDATCNAVGVVTAEGQVVESALVLSEGKKASSGVLLMEGDKARYLPSNATDIKDLITSLVEIVNQIATIATGLDAVTVSPGTQAANIVALQLLKTELELTKEQLK